MINRDGTKSSLKWPADTMVATVTKYLWGGSLILAISLSISAYAAAQWWVKAIFVIASVLFVLVCYVLYGIAFHRVSITLEDNASMVRIVSGAPGRTPVTYSVGLNAIRGVSVFPTSHGEHPGWKLVLETYQGDKILLIDQSPTNLEAKGKQIAELFGCTLKSRA